MGHRPIRPEFSPTGTKGLSEVMKGLVKGELNERGLGIVYHHVLFDYPPFCTVHSNSIFPFRPDTP